MSKLANVSVVHVPVTLAGFAVDSRLEFLVLSMQAPVLIHDYEAGDAAMADVTTPDVRRPLAMMARKE